MFDVVRGATGSSSVQTAGSSVQVVSPDFGPCTQAQMGESPPMTQTNVHNHVSNWYTVDAKIGQSMLEETVSLVREYAGVVLNEKEQGVVYDGSCRRFFVFGELAKASALRCCRWPTTTSIE